MVLANQNLDIDPKLTRPAQHLDHAPRRRYPAARKPREFYIDHRAIQLAQPCRAIRRCAMLRQKLGRQLIARRDHHLLVQARFVRKHHIPARAVAEHPHHRRMRAPQHAQNAPLRAPPAVASAYDAARCVRSRGRRASRPPIGQEV